MIKKYFFFSIIFFWALSCNLNIEEVVNQNDEGIITERYHVNKKTGLKQGEFISYYPDGKVFETSVYREDLLHGERSIFYENGQVMQKEMLVNGEYIGQFKKFFEDGTLKVEGIYVENYMDGPWKVYYSNGQLKEEVTFLKNIENGPFIEYHENGKLKAEGTYMNGDFEHGELKLYNENGVLEKIMDCDKGICHTRWKKEDDK